MEFNTLNDLKRLEDQIFQYNPNVKSTEKKKYVRDRLRYQLLHSKAVVQLRRMDEECESLMISIKERLMLLQDSSDDEVLSTLVSKDAEKRQKVEQADNFDSMESHLQLAFCQKPRQRRLSYKSCSSGSTSRPMESHKKLQKKHGHTVTASTFHSEEVLVEQEELDTTPTLHIKIPSLHRGNVHYLILDSLKFARKVFDYRANDIKLQQQQRNIAHGSKKTKSRKKQLAYKTAPVLQQLAQEQDLDLSQFIQDVMAETCNEETLQATNALENINKNLTNNYDFVENDSFINCSQSSQEFSCSQNSNIIVDTVSSTRECSKKRKKYNKTTKRSSAQEQNQPPKKRGRKPKMKSNLCISQLQLQSHTKSNLAQYVELFSNDCEMPPGSTTPAASSTRSLPLVSSTTHNFEIVDQNPQEEELQNSPEQPITYYIDGDWANGGPCQLVTKNQADNSEVQNFVHYTDNIDDSRSNVIAPFLQCHNNLPVSVPQSIANFTFQNKDFRQATHHIHQQPPTLENSLLPVINIQIPPIPNNICCSEPRPAHMSTEIIDLSIKSKSSETFNLIQKSKNNMETVGYRTAEEFLPLDLSVNSDYEKENIITSIDTQDDDFIRQLIEDNGFDYRTEELRKGNEDEISVYNYDNEKSFKEALDMPLLEFDDTDLVELVENTANKSNQLQNMTTDKMDDSVSKNNSNFVSMSNVHSTVGNSLNFCGPTSTEIFNKLLNICPGNHFVNEVNNQETKNISNDETPSSTSLSIQFGSSHTTKNMSLNLNNLDNNKSSESQSSEITLEFILKTPPITKISNETCNTIKQLSTSVNLESLPDIDNSETIFESNECSTNNKFLNSDVMTNQEKVSVSKENSKSQSTESIRNIFNSLSKGNNADTERLTGYSNFQSKENVLFSVAKITLSEDDNVYNTDSDVSIAKACDFSEQLCLKYNKSSETTSSNEYDKNEFDFYNNEVEKSQYIEKSIHKEVVNLYNNLNCNEVKNQKSEIKNILDPKNCDVSNEKLPGSELEYVMDSDEDLDDALSLATSCFDTPNCDRFEDSVVDINAATTTNALQDKVYSNSSDIKELNNFKIPKLTNSADLPEEIIISSSSPTNSVAYKPHIENVTRTIVNDLVQLNTDANITPEAKPIENEKLIADDIISKVFGITCLRFLVDKCNDITTCQLSHKLNDEERVFFNLISLEKSHVNFVYQVMYNHMKLFKVYFNTFCNYYTNKNDRVKLRNMINDCERYPECAEFLIAIYEGLVKCGLNRVNACRLLIKCIREKSIATSIVEALVTIIMKSDWTMFSDFIEKYTEEIYQFHFRISILEQMAPSVLCNQRSHLKRVFGKCVQTLLQDEMGLLLNSPTLIQCIALLTSNT